MPVPRMDRRRPAAPGLACRPASASAPMPSRPPWRWLSCGCQQTRSAASWPARRCRLRWSARCGSRRSCRAWLQLSWRGARPRPEGKRRHYGQAAAQEGPAPGMPALMRSRGIACLQGPWQPGRATAPHLIQGQTPGQSPRGCCWPPCCSVLHAAWLLQQESRTARPYRQRSTDGSSASLSRRRALHPWRRPQRQAQWVPCLRVERLRLRRMAPAACARRLPAAPWPQPGRCPSLPARGRAAQPWPPGPCSNARRRASPPAHVAALAAPGLTPAWRCSRSRSSRSCSRWLPGARCTRAGGLSLRPRPSSLPVMPQQLSASLRALPPRQQTSETASGMRIRRSGSTHVCRRRCLRQHSAALAACA